MELPYTLQTASSPEVIRKGLKLFKFQLELILYWLVVRIFLFYCVYFLMFYVCLYCHLSRLYFLLSFIAAPFFVLLCCFMLLYFIILYIADAFMTVCAAVSSLFKDLFLHCFYVNGFYVSGLAYPLEWRRGGVKKTTKHVKQSLIIQ